MIYSLVYFFTLRDVSFDWDSFYCFFHTAVKCLKTFLPSTFLHPPKFHSSETLSYTRFHNLYNSLFIHPLSWYVKNYVFHKVTVILLRVPEHFIVEKFAFNYKTSHSISFVYPGTPVPTETGKESINYSSKVKTWTKLTYSICKTL